MKASGEQERNPQLGFRIEKFIYCLRQRLYYDRKSIRIKRLPWASIDSRLMRVFLDPSIDERKRYTELFSYLVSGFLYYGLPDHTYVYYPGALSSHGAEVDAMEGSCRILPMIAAWLSSGRPSVIEDYEGRPIDLLQIIKMALLAGTDPESAGYWGHIGDRDQRIVEAADVALSVWLLRNHLWPQLSSHERENISGWLLSVNGRSVHDNNWHLFPLMINEVLASLGCDNDRASALKHFERVKAFYRGNGWFSDGPAGAYDYYNAWCFHYSLFWINLIDPGLDPQFIDDSLNDFVRNFKYLISTEGVPITGRSICYRIAVTAPLIAAANRGLDGISSGMARRAMDCVWKYFIARKAVCRGRITQGYCKEDLRLLDNYSGPGSSLWSTRSLVLAFYNPPGSEFWKTPLEPLPIEQADYVISIPEIQWEIRGSHSTREVQIVKKDKTGLPNNEIDNISLLDKFRIFILRLPYRFNNDYSRYELHRYSSLHPFWSMGSPENRLADRSGNT
jgi:hypothetical protein